MAAALAGGAFDLGDRVACLRGTGSPALGARGTVVGAFDMPARLLPSTCTMLYVLRKLLITC